jgi:DNA-binding NtrC family response regulator
MATPKKETILVVDDSPMTVKVLQRNLSMQGFRVFTAPGVVEAIRVLEKAPIDLVITDYRMPKIAGTDLIRHVRENFGDTEIMMITGYATIEGAVEAMRAGADEYLTKPFTDEELFAAVRGALERLHTRREGRTSADRRATAPQGLIGESEVMGKVFRAIAKATRSSATVLVTGESGTGKELVARAIHYGSTRASAPFVPVNCGGIPEGLLESELFGHVKGAFTGASESRAGFFTTAEGGTVFLDEISETSPSMQVKLLRVLQDKEVCMVGASRPRKVDVAIVAATNKDLLSLVKKGIFREDLFYRLNVIAIDVPPLRERGNDILQLIRHFGIKYAKELDQRAPRLSDSALRVLKNYHWPGNVRELENLVQRLLVMAEGELIDVPDLPSYLRFSALRGAGLDRTLADVEAEHIRNVLSGADGNKTRAAEILGIDRKTLREKLRRYSLDET